MGVIDRIERVFFPGERDRPLTLDEWASYFNFDSLSYPLIGSSTLSSKEERIASDFGGLVAGAYKANGVVFACMVARQLLFAEARFQFRNRSGQLFGTTALARLEKPWPGGTTADLLSRAIQDVDLGGNAFFTPYREGLKRLRPDWITIVMGGDEGLDYNSEVLGYLYHPGGKASGKDPIVLFPESVAHFAPIPDPAATYRGMSWLTPIIREIMSDKAATQHKLKFFEQGATPNMVVTMDPTIGIEAAKRWKELFLAENEGLSNAYKTMFLGGGASQEVVGANFRQIDFKATQAGGERRIAATARVPEMLVGIGEPPTYANFQAARRSFADGTIRPLWRNLCGSLENIITVPPGGQLWYDDRDIPFVQEDRKDDAEIKQAQAATINTLITAGYQPDSAVQAVISGDFSKLVHTGLTSVQLLPPGESSRPESNGKVPAEAMPELDS